MKQRKLRKKPKIKKALDVALFFLKFRPRSCFEVERKLKFKKYSSDEIEKTLGYLEREGLINDLEFAKMWIRHRLQLKPMASRILFLELKKFGIDDEICEKALLVEDLPDEEKIEMIYEAKKRAWLKLSAEEFKKKMTGFLARRGFNWGDISSVLSKK